MTDATPLSTAIGERQQVARRAACPRSSLTTGSAMWESTVVRPCPGKCLAQASAPASWQPSIQVRTQARDPIRVVAERAGLHDRVVGQHVEISHRREDPVDAHGARLLRGDGAGPPHHGGVPERRERERRRELGEPGHLLPRPALEIGRDEQRPARAAEQVGRQPPHRFDGATEDDEAADAEVERVGDAGGLVPEAAVRRRREARER